MYLRKQLNIHMHIFMLRDDFSLLQKGTVHTNGTNKRDIFVCVAHPWAITLHFQSIRKKAQALHPHPSLRARFFQEAPVFRRSTGSTMCAVLS